MKIHIGIKLMFVTSVKHFYIQDTFAISKLCRIFAEHREKVKIDLCKRAGMYTCKLQMWLKSDCSPPHMHTMYLKKYLTWLPTGWFITFILYILHQVCGSTARGRDCQTCTTEEGICTYKQKEYICIHYPRHYINVVLAKEIICTLYTNVLFGI